MIIDIHYPKIKNAGLYDLGSSLIDLQNSWTKGQNNQKRLLSNYVIVGAKYLHLKYEDQKKWLRIKDFKLHTNARITEVSDIVESEKRLFILFATNEGYTNKQNSLLYQLKMNLDFNLPKLEQLDSSKLNGDTRFERRECRFAIRSGSETRFYTPRR